MTAPQVKVRDLPQPGQVDLGIDPRSVCGAMAEMIANLLQAQPCRDEMAGASMAKPVRTMAGYLNAQCLDATADNVVHGARREGPERGFERHEEFSRCTKRSSVPEILENCVTDRGHQGVILRPPLLRPFDPDDLSRPIQVLKAQFTLYHCATRRWRATSGWRGRVCSADPRRW